MAENSKPCFCQLPLTRIKTIMKSSPEVSTIGQESLFLIAKATELFIQDITLRTLKRSNDPTNVDYKELADIVNNQDTLMFLTDIIPPKITVAEYYALNGRQCPGTQGAATENSLD